MTTHSLPSSSGRGHDERLAALAHELRNRLAPIRNAATLLRDASQGDPLREWIRNVIERQVHELARLTDDLLDPFASSDLGRGSRRAAEAGRSRRARVLVVDDNRDAAESLSMLLELRGFDASVCHDGSTALAIALQSRPDAIVLDLGLPGIDGFQVCRQLREAGMAKACIVAVTGFGRDEDRDRSQAVGFDAHLLKPVEPDELVERIEESLARD